MANSEAGRPTILNDALRLKIARFILEMDEPPTLERVAEGTDLSIHTLKLWHSTNFLDFYTFFRGLRRDWKLAKSEKNIDDFLSMSTMNTSTTISGETFEYDDPRLKKIKADATFFVAETIGKKDYSKRSALADDDGKMAPPIIQILSFDKNDRINANHTVQLDAGAASDASVSKSGEVQSSGVASESPQNNSGDKRVNPSGVCVPGSVLVCNSILQSSQEDCVARTGDATEILPAKYLGQAKQLGKLFDISERLGSFSLGCG